MFHRRGKIPPHFRETQKKNAPVNSKSNDEENQMEKNSRMKKRKRRRRRKEMRKRRKNLILEIREYEKKKAIHRVWMQKDSERVCCLLCVMAYGRHQWIEMRHYVPTIIMNISTTKDRKHSLFIWIGRLARVLCYCVETTIRWKRHSPKLQRASIDPAIRVS